MLLARPNERAGLLLQAADPELPGNERASGTVLLGSRKMASDGRWMDVKIKMFCTGVWWGQKWTRRKLHGLVDHFKAHLAPGDDLYDWKVPVQVDHSSSSRDTVGHLRDVNLVGRWIVGDARIVDLDAIKRVETGQFCRTSIGLWSTDEGQSWEIFHHSFVPFPLVPEARIAARPIAEGGCAMSDTTGRQTEALATLEGARATEEGRAPVETAYQAAITEMQAQILHLSGQLAALQGEKEALVARAVETEEALRRQALKSRTDAWVLAGKTTPAMRPHEEKLLGSLSDEQLALYEALKASLPALVSLNQTFGIAEASKPGDARSEEDVKRDVAAFLTRHPALAARFGGQA